MQVLGLFIELEERFPKDLCSILLEEAKMILESALELQNSVEEGSIRFWKDAYCTLVMVEKMLKLFPDLCFEQVFEVEAVVSLNPSPDDMNLLFEIT